MEEVFEGLRPTTVAEERHSAQLADVSAQMDHALGETAKLTVQTETRFEPQFNSEYQSRAFPWSLNYRAGGADFLGFGQQSPDGPSDSMKSSLSSLRWRRLKGAAILTPQRNVKNLARRVEMQIANDWSLVPAMRNVSLRYAALESCYASCWMNAPTNQPLEATATSLVTAAEQLYSKLKTGTVTMQGKKRPIKGDMRLLRHADDLSSQEKLLLDSYRRVTKNFAGSQEIRQKAGHCLFGLRATHGEGLFITLSPSRRHSTLNSATLSRTIQRYVFAGF